MSDVLKEAADWLAQDDATCWGEHEWRLFNVVEYAEALTARIEELEAKIKSYMEAEADACGGAPDKYKARKVAFLELRTSIDWPTKASADKARATLKELKGETDE